MAKLLLICFSTALLANVDCNGQNMIANDGFECSSDNVCSWVNWPDQFENYVCEWSCPTGGTADIFSTLVNSTYCWAKMPYAGVDQSLDHPHVGSEMPRSGDKFVGIQTIIKKQPEYREYIQNKLIEPLQKGQAYCFRMFVSLADNVSVGTNLSAYFYKDYQRNFQLSTTWDGDPQVNHPDPIMLTNGWYEVSQLFTANDAYEYVAIGNFDSDNAIKVADRADARVFYKDEAYYFIDDVSLTPFENQNVNFHGSKTLCEGETGEVEAIGVFDEIYWTSVDDSGKILTHGKTFRLSPSKTTKYVAVTKSCNHIERDTIEIKVLPKQKIDLGNDTTVCEGQILKLDAGEAVSYRWNTGAITRNLDVKSTGTYQVSIIDSQGCTAIDTVVINFKQKPALNLGRDTVVCEGFFSILVNTQDEIVWSNGEMTNILKPTGPGIFSATARNECGTDMDTIVVSDINNLFVPNVLTINDDELNSRFSLLGPGSKLKPALRIFNLWGQEVYYGKHYENDWPSPPESENLSPGTYFYWLSFPGCRDFKGTLHLIKD